MAGRMVVVRRIIASLSDEDLQCIKENDPYFKSVVSCGNDGHIRNMSDEELEELGKNISTNTHLVRLELYEGAINDHTMSCLFRGLTRSSFIKTLQLYDNGLSVAGVRSMVPFLQNANNLTWVILDDNNIQSEGFNLLFRALRNSPIERLSSENCRIESIEIDSKQRPKHLRYLHLDGNNINTNGCRGLAALLQGGDATLEHLYLEYNNIDDIGVEILVDALQNDTTLKEIDLEGNYDISKRGLRMLLKLVNDISSIKATLQSNHTLKCIFVREISEVEPLDASDEIQHQINVATRINVKFPDDPDRAGKVKVIQTQLNCDRRSALCSLLDVNHSVYSEIDPLYLPEVLSMIGHNHNQGEVYAALSSSIMALLSTVNVKKCLQQERAYHAAKVKELDAKLILLAEEEARSNWRSRLRIKRRRKWWRGLFLG